MVATFIERSLTVCDMGDMRCKKRPRGSGFIGTWLREHWNDCHCGNGSMGHSCRSQLVRLWICDSIFLLFPAGPPSLLTTSLPTHQQLLNKPARSHFSPTLVHQFLTTAPTTSPHHVEPQYTTSKHSVLNCSLTCAFVPTPPNALYSRFAHNSYIPKDRLD